MRKITTLLAAFLWVQMGFAQNAKVAVIQELEKTATDLVGAINDLTKSKNAQPVLSFMHPRMREELTIYNIDGKSETLNSDLAGLKLTLESYKKTPNFNIDCTIGRFLKTEIINDTLAYAIYEMNYNLSEGIGKNVYTKGLQTAVTQWVKTNGKWLLLRNTSIRELTSVNRSVCSCSLFERSGDYVAQVRLPDGNAYTTEFATIKVVTKGNTKELIVNGKQSYILRTDGKAYLSSPSKKTLEIKSIGNNHVMEALLGDLFTEKCFTVEIK